MVSAQSEKEILLGKTRGYIYDRNYLPLVNDSAKKYAAFITSDDNKFVNDSYELKTKSGICYAAEISDDRLSPENAVNYSLTERYNSNLCAHLIGYIDSDGYGISGIEKAFDRILDEASGEIKISYIADGTGNVFSGTGLSIIEDNYNSEAGIVLTIDKEIQIITESALLQSDICCGAVVVLKAETAEIIACASIPVYDRNNISASLNDENRPFINRAISAYPVGSVFKPFIAAAAIKDGLNFSDMYNCTGNINIGENVFNCYNSKSHGLTDLNGAIEKSCNCYFINAGLKTDKILLCDTIKKFGFGKEIKLCSAINSDSGSFSEANEISSDSQLANLCFGQGDLLATPLQVAAAYCVLANKGIYNKPVLFKELVDDNKEVYGYYKNQDSEKIIDAEICETINACLYNNMLNGTGIYAQPENISAAGKTATAQTGIFNNGVEVLNTWFAGFFPYESPEYVIVVFNEKGSTASYDCAPVFKNIADAICDYENKKELINQ